MTDIDYMNSSEDLAPVSVFVYNRADKAKKCLELLANARYAKDTEIYIYCDGAKNEQGKAGVESTRNEVKDSKWESCFKKLTVVERPVNFGCKKSIISGITNTINEKGRTIVVEDDIHVGKDFLRFMNDCLKYYENDPKVWSIGGVCIDFDSLKTYSKDVYAMNRTESWGWATWADRWNKVDWDMKDYTAFKRDAKAKSAFAQGGEDLITELKKEMEQNYDNWDIIWCYAQFVNDGYTVFPRKSLAANEGFDGVGTHCESGNSIPYLPTVDEFDYHLESVEPDPSIMEELRRFYKETPLTKIYNNLPSWGRRLARSVYRK